MNKLGILKTKYKEILYIVIAVIVAFVIAVLISKTDYKNNAYTVSISEFENNGFGMESERLALPAGNYVTTINYSIPFDCEIAVMMNNAYLATLTAPATFDGNINTVTLSYVIPWSTSDLHIVFNGVFEDDFNVSYVNVASDKSLNFDAKFKAIVAFVVMLMFIAFAYMLAIKKVSVRKGIIVAIITSAVLYVSMPLYADVIFAGHDLWGLCGRIEGIKEAWDCGQIYPVVMPNAFNGYGYLEFMYPELFLLIPAFLRKIDVSMVVSLHFYEFLINIATAVIAYFSVKSILNELSSNDDKYSKSDIIATVATVFYVLTQYRLADLYTRAAIGEAVSMTFLPIAIAGLFHILDGNRKRWWMAVVGMSGLLHSHILSCTLIIPVVIVMGIGYFANIVKDARYKEIIKSIIAFLLINAWDIIPFVRFYMYGLNTDALVVEDVESHTVLLRQLFSTTAGHADSDYFLRTLGIASLVAIVCVVVYFVEKSGANLLSESIEDKKAFKLEMILSVVFIAFLIMSLDIMPYKWLMSKGGIIYSMLSMLQFPFRLLTISSACIAIIMPIAIYKSDFLKNSINVVCVMLMIASIMGAGSLNDEFMSGFVSMKPLTGGFENHVPYDYLPKETDTSVIYDTSAYIDNGAIDMVKIGTDVTVNYESDVDTEAVIPLFYYPCYSAEDENGNAIELYKGNDNKLTMKLPKGQHTVKLNVNLY